MYLDILKILITIFTAGAGWYVLNKLYVRRDIQAKRHELVTQNLIESYHQLSKVACCLLNGDPLSKEMASELNQALMSVQLFGSSEQIDLAEATARFINGSSAIDTEEFQYLIYNIREGLREELDLLKVGPLQNIEYPNAKTKKAYEEQP